MLAFPGIFVSAGLALTEMISVCLISLSLCLLEFNPQRKATGGVLLGLATLSRQTLITQAAALPITRLLGGKDTSSWTRTLLGALLTIAITAPMFLVWGGLLPFDESQESIKSHPPLNPLNIALGIGYLAVIGSLVGKFKIELHWRSLLIAASIFLLSAGVAAALGWHYLPMKSVLTSSLGPSVEWLSLVLPALSITVMVAGIIWTVQNRQRLQSMQQSWAVCWTFSLLSIAILVLTNGGIAHQFSSRYLVVGAPYFAVVFGQCSPRISGFLLLIAGNVFSLLSYV